MENIIIQEVGISVVKGAIGAIPLVGTALNEVVFECRGRIKQGRVNRFIAELTKYMQEVTENQINYPHIKSEEFSDIFESILKRIVYNKSEEKMHRFKNILIKNMMVISNSDYSETFLDIVSKINEKQIEILDIYRKIECKELISDDNLKERHVIDGNFVEKLSKYRSFKYYDLAQSTYNFYVQDLISKSLLVDDGMGRVGSGPFDILKVTEFGIEFLKFIEGK